MKSIGDICKCGICGKMHRRRDGEANKTSPICHKCAATFESIPEGQGPKDKVNIQLRNWK